MTTTNTGHHERGNFSRPISLYGGSTEQAVVSSRIDYVSAETERGKDSCWKLAWGFTIFMSAVYQ